MKSAIFGCEMVDLTDDDFPPSEERMIVTLKAVIEATIGMVQEKEGVIITNNDIVIRAIEGHKEIDVEWTSPTTGEVYGLAIGESVWSAQK